jgi:hypothetical protein
VFEDWNRSELDSFLIEITKDILKFKDSDGEFCGWCFGCSEHLAVSLWGARASLVRRTDGNGTRNITIFGIIVTGQ